MKNFYKFRYTFNRRNSLRSIKHTIRKYRPYYYFRLKWNFEDSLSKITVPTLLIGSRYDIVDTADLYVIKNKIKNSEVYVCPNGSYFAFWDDAENYFKALIKFITKAKKISYNYMIFLNNKST